MTINMPPGWTPQPHTNIDPSLHATLDDIKDNQEMKDEYIGYITEKLKEVYDPEISVNVFDLGLIYGIDIDEENHWVTITHTLTSAFCPFADEIVENIRQAGMVESVLHVEVNTTFDPPFTIESVPEETRMMMGW